VAHRPHVACLPHPEHGGGGARALAEIVALAVVMQRDERIDAPLHRRRQVVVRAVLIGEQRVAAVLRHLDRIEQRGARRDVEVGVIGVEISARIGEADRLAVLLAVRKGQGVWILASMEPNGYRRPRGSGRPNCRAKPRNSPGLRLWPRMTSTCAAKNASQISRNGRAMLSVSAPKLPSFVTFIRKRGQSNFPETVVTEKLL